MIGRAELSAASVWRCTRQHVLQAAECGATARLAAAAPAVAHRHSGSRDQHCAELLTAGSTQQLRQAVLQSIEAATAAAMQAAALGRLGRWKKATQPQSLTQPE
jgi:hypothetical protein